MPPIPSLSLLYNPTFFVAGLAALPFLVILVLLFYSRWHPMELHHLKELARKRGLAFKESWGMDTLPDFDFFHASSRYRTHGYLSTVLDSAASMHFSQGLYGDWRSVTHPTSGSKLDSELRVSTAWVSITGAHFERIKMLPYTGHIIGSLALFKHNPAVDIDLELSEFAFFEGIPDPELKFKLQGLAQQVGPFGLESKGADLLVVLPGHHVTEARIEKFLRTVELIYQDLIIQEV